MLGIELRKVTKKVTLINGLQEVIFENFDFQTNESEVVGLYGPNGCGKTTLLNLISGVVQPDCGNIQIFGQKPQGRKISYIFQDYKNSLFPWMTVKENILFPLLLHKKSKKEMANKLEAAREKFSIPFDLNRYPYQLSGGQMQYVAILRGLISEPEIMLIDEPFSAIDYNNCKWLIEHMMEAFEQIKMPVVIVDHNIEHLISVSDKICFFLNKPNQKLIEKTVTSELKKGVMAYSSTALMQFNEELKIINFCNEALVG